MAMDSERYWTLLRATLRCLGRSRRALSDMVEFSEVRSGQRRKHLPERRDGMTPMRDSGDDLTRAMLSFQKLDKAFSGTQVAKGTAKG